MAMLPPIEPRKPKSFYERFGKRALDIICSSIALVGLAPVLLFVAILVRAKLGSPVLFKQVRPGIIDSATGQETLFELCKFRTMTDERDAEGNLLPDDVRLTKFGKALRSTSLDELPELLNILKGDMSVIGPRPQLVRDMVFMDSGERKRHTVRPGLSGLAQISGRNAIAWEDKLDTDLEYIKNISFREDFWIVLRTFVKVFEREGISTEGMETAEDYGDYLLRIGHVEPSRYEMLQKESQELAHGR